MSILYLLGRCQRYILSAYVPARVRSLAASVTCGCFFTPRSPVRRFDLLVAATPEPLSRASGLHAGVRRRGVSGAGAGCQQQQAGQYGVIAARGEKTFGYCSKYFIRANFAH